MPKSEETSIPKTDGSGNVRTLENIHMDGLGILGFVNAKVPDQIRGILDRNGMFLDDIDLFVFHQASQLALDSLTRLLKLQPRKVFQNLQYVGNTVSASIPIALKDLIDVEGFPTTAANATRTIRCGRCCTISRTPHRRATSSARC
ncbi:MAG: hypothetical protein IH851_14020 [Armatimonadetes bacterium]|nr:hypothetical protein [Armatimonadota bacterium]